MKRNYNSTTAFGVKLDMMTASYTFKHKPSLFQKPYDILWCQSRKPRHVPVRLAYIPASLLQWGYLPRPP